MKLGDMLANPIRPLGNESRFGSLALFLGEYARADQRPQRLVVVLRGGFHDGDIIVLSLRRNWAATVMPAVPPPRIKT